MTQYSTVNEMPREELENACQTILSKHSVATVMKKTALGYSTVYRLRKSSKARSTARQVTLMLIVSVFLDDIK